MIEETVWEMICKFPTSFIKDGLLDLSILIFLESEAWRKYYNVSDNFFPQLKDRSLLYVHKWNNNSVRSNSNFSVTTMHVI